MTQYGVKIVYTTTDGKEHTDYFVEDKELTEEWAKEVNKEWFKMHNGFIKEITSWPKSV